MSKANRHAQIYDVTPGTISRWILAGVRTGKKPPLDFPERMPGWWEEMVTAGEFEKGVPTKMQAAADRANAVLRTGGDDDEQGESPPSGMSAFMDAVDRGDITLDYSDGLRIAKKNVLLLEFLVNHAVTTNNIKEISRYRKELTDAGDALRALEKDRGKIQADAGQTLSKEEVRAALLEIHGNIQRQFRQRLRYAYLEAQEHLQSKEAWSLFCEGLVDTICGKLTETKFAAD